MTEQIQATKVLFVEDDPHLGLLVRENLEDHGYEVLFCVNGEEGWKTFMRNNVDLCILDIMVPKKDGITLAKQIRKKNQDVPILFLTAKSMEEDKIAGFKAGGDDYITKPFSMEELLLRMEVFLKRTQKGNPDETIFTLGKLTFDSNNLVIIKDGKEQQLTQKESDLLRYLCLNTNQVIKREDILLNVWGKEDYFLGRSMDVFMTKIRKFLKEDDTIELQTIHGVGFKLLIPEEN